MQNYKEINGNDYVKDSRTTINETMRSIQSMNSGTAFPTNNLFEGMKCYRTDLKKTYTLTDVGNNTWAEDTHVSLADTASKLSTARKINITGDATGAAAFDGSGDISINTTVNESKHAAAATTVNATAPNGGAADLAFGTMAVNDYARIRVYGKDDNGALEIATADGGNEPIYVRQYGGSYDWPNGRPGVVMNEAAILDANGNTKFPKNVTAASFTGPLNGTATKATQDTNGRAFTDTNAYMHISKLANGTDFNNVKMTGIYLCNQDTYTNRPHNSWGILTVYSIGTVKQEYKPDDAAVYYTREYNNTNWTAWSKVAASTADTCTGNSSTATKLADENGHNHIEINSTTDSWGVIGSNPGKWLKSVRTNAIAPPYSIGNFSAAVAFGGGDTKGIITHAYDDPLVKFAGGNGSTAQWKFSIRGGRNNETYDLNNFPTKTGSGASGTWGINISGTATNADKVDGYHATDIFRQLGGHNTPVITDIFDRAGTIDMSTMSAADKTTHKNNINKASNMTQNIWNTDTGMRAYGGDYDIAGYNRGTLKLTQSYKNFDKILVVCIKDKGYVVFCRLWDVWELAHAFANYHSFFLANSDSDYWMLYSTTKHGNTTAKWSTDTVWSCAEQNSGIVAIYGIKY